MKKDAQPVATANALSSVRKVDNGAAIEVIFREPGDLALEHGGPIYQYEKEAGTWKQLQGFSGNWEPNKALQPTPMSVTPPAAQESRQP